MAKIYSCFPVKDLRIGTFVFQDGRMVLEDKNRINEFETYLAQMRETKPAVVAGIKEIDINAAQRLAASYARPVASQGVATTDSLLAAQRIADDADKSLRAAATAAGDLTDAAKVAELASAAKEAAAQGVTLKLS